MREFHYQCSGWENIHILQCQSSTRVEVTVDEYKLILGTSLYNCTISESSEFTQPVAKSLELPDCLATTKTKVHYGHYWRHSVKKLLSLFNVQQET